jgi:hypothetical protein
LLRQQIIDDGYIKQASSKSLSFFIDKMYILVSYGLEYEFDEEFVIMWIAFYGCDIDPYNRLNKRCSHKIAVFIL